MRCKTSNECHTVTSPAQKLKPSMHWSQVCAPGAGRDQLLPLSSLVATLGPSRTYPVAANPEWQLIDAKRDTNLEPIAAPTSFMLSRTNGTQACSWNSQNHAVLPKASCKTSNDCHTATCSRPPKSPKTSTTATKRSSGNAYSHVCSASSGGSRVFSC